MNSVCATAAGRRWATGLYSILRRRNPCEKCSNMRYWGARWRQLCISGLLAGRRSAACKVAARTEFWENVLSCMRDWREVWWVERKECISA